MIKIEPILTEKTLKLAEEGKYTFRIGSGLDKFKIKKMIESIFGVHVASVRTIKEAEEKKRNLRGMYRIIPESKKAVVTLKNNEKLELFDVAKKK